MTTVPESRNDETACAGPTRVGTPTITECGDGPLLVRGNFELIGDDGTAITMRRSTVALCRCGRTRIAPFCDSSHKKKRSQADR